MGKMNELLLIIPISIILVFVVIYLIRKYLLTTYALQALDMASTTARKMIDQDVDNDWTQVYKILDSFPAFNLLLPIFMLHKWSFKSLYPGLEEKLEGLIK